MIPTRTMAELDVSTVGIPAGTSLNREGAPMRSIRARLQAWRDRTTPAHPLALVTVPALGLLVWQLTVTPISAHVLYALGLLASAGAVLALVTSLRAEVHRAERNAAELMDAFVRARQDVDDNDLAHRSRLHDARSALTSIAGAVAAQSRNSRSGRVDERLNSMIDSELRRLHALLDSESSEPLTDFDLLAALEPILIAHRVNGLRIQWSITTITVRGRALATASVLDNLLRNAAVHAPGAQVEVHLSTDSGAVTVVVDDDGPGIPAAERHAALRAGSRRADTSRPGHGLGLHSAATVMTEQSGALRLAEAPSGGTRASFTLQLASEQHARLATIHPMAS